VRRKLRSRRLPSGVAVPWPLAAIEPVLVGSPLCRLTGSAGGPPLTPPRAPCDMFIVHNEGVHVTRIKLPGLAVCSAAALALPASASALNTGTPPGPPAVSGGPAPPGALVAHCKVLTGGKGVAVFNSNGVSGNGDCGIL